MSDTESNVTIPPTSTVLQDSRESSSGGKKSPVFDEKRESLRDTESNEYNQDSNKENSGRKSPLENESKKQEATGRDSPSAKESNASGSGRNSPQYDTEKELPTENVQQESNQEVNSGTKSPTDDSRKISPREEQERSDSPSKEEEEEEGTISDKGETNKNESDFEDTKSNAEEKVEGDAQESTGDGRNDDREDSEQHEKESEETKPEMEDQNKLETNDEMEDQNREETMESPKEQEKETIEDEDHELKKRLTILEEEERPLNEKIDLLSELLDNERDKLLEIPLKDYKRLEYLKSVISSSRQVCRHTEDKMIEMTTKMNGVTQSINSLQKAVDKKITNEGLLTWAEQLKTDPSDPDSVAREKVILAQAAEAKVVLSKATDGIPKAEEKAAQLVVQAAEAAAEANKAQQNAEEACIAAEAARKAAEKKKQEEEEAKRKAEEDRKRKEEEERKIREEEERRKMEQDLLSGSPEERERKRLEAERRDPKNWPVWVYSVDPGTTGIPIGCAIKALPDTASRDDFTVEKLDQLSGVLKLGDNDELVSNIIKITHSNEEFKTMEPLSVSIPHCATRNPSRECVVKMLQPNGNWVEVTTKDIVFDDMKEYKFVECRLQKVAMLAVVTRIKREQHTVHKRGGKVVPSVDTRVCFTVRQSMFKVSTTVTVEVYPVESSLVSDIRHRKPNCSGLLASSPVVHFQTPLKKFPKSIMVNLPLPASPSKQKQRPATASTGSKGNNSNTASNRPKSAFSAAYTKQEDEEEETVHLLTLDPEGQWVVVENIQLVQPKNKDIVTFEMNKPMSKFLLLRTKAEVSIAGIERIATDIEMALRERIVQFCLRQKSDDANDVVIQCSLANRMESTLRRLSEKGYDYGPLPSSDIVMFEGQPMKIAFRGNVVLEQSEPIEFVFNSHIKTKMNFQVAVQDTFAQKSISCYRGFAQLFAISKHEVGEAFEQNNQLEQLSKLQLLSEHLINLPKPEPEAPKPIVERAPVNVKIDGLLDREMLQQLASELGEEWKRLAHYLEVKKVRIQAIVRNNVQKDLEHTINDMLLTWIKRVPKSANKVEILCHALIRCGRVDLAESLKDRDIDFKRERSLSARDSYLRKAFVKIAQSPHVATDWKFLARRLELKELEIQEVDDSFPGVQKKCFHSLIKWREVCGVDATPDLLEQTLRKCRYFNLADQVHAILKDAI